MDFEHATNICLRVGAFLGIALFIVFGIKVGIVYGGLVGAMTAASMLGHAIAGELLARVIVAGGMLMGVLAVGSLMTVLGAIAGASFNAFVLAPVAKLRAARLVTVDK